MIVLLKGLRRAGRMPALTHQEKRTAAGAVPVEFGVLEIQIGRPTASRDKRLQGGKLAAREPVPGPISIGRPVTTEGAGL